MAGSLAGKIAIVTGGSRNIGAAIAFELARRGAAGVAITYVSNEKAAKSVVEKIESLRSKAIAVKADIGDPEAGKLVVNATLKGFQTPQIDIVVNNAASAEFMPLTNVSADAFARTFDSNVRAVIFMARAVLPVIRRGGCMEVVTKGLAMDYGAQYGITVNNVMPGPIETDHIGNAPKEVVQQLVNQTTAEKRLGTGDDIAQIVAFLVEEGSRWVHGDTISATGGLDM